LVVLGNRNVIGVPISEKVQAGMIGAAWAAAFGLSCAWLSEDGTYGSYKNLYCAIRPSAYKPYLTAPCFVMTFFSIDALLWFSFSGLDHIAYSKTPTDAQIILRRGFIHGVSHYVLWAGLIAVGKSFIPSPSINWPPFVLSHLPASSCCCSPTTSSLLVA